MIAAALSTPLVVGISAAAVDVALYNVGSRTVILGVGESDPNDCCSTFGSGDAVSSLSWRALVGALQRSHIVQCAHDVLLRNVQLDVHVVGCAQRQGPRLGGGARFVPDRPAADCPTDQRPTARLGARSGTAPWRAPWPCRSSAAR